MTRSPPNLHTMVPRRAGIQDVLKVKVKVKGHVIRALLWCHEMFAIQYGLTFCLYMRSLYETPWYRYSPSKSSISIRQLSKYWNELLRHWRSGYYYKCTEYSDTDAKLSQGHFTKTTTKGTMDPDRSARNSCNSWPLYARWADQRACFGGLLQLLRALPSWSMHIN